MERSMFRTIYFCETCDQVLETKMVFSEYKLQRILYYSHQAYKALTISRILAEEGLRASRVGGFKLHWAFIRPNDIIEYYCRIEGLCHVLAYPFEVLHLVHLTNQLTIVAASKGPPKQGATVKNHPQWDMLSPWTFSIACTGTAVVLPSARIFCSTKALISVIFLDGRPECGCQEMLPVCW